MSLDILTFEDARVEIRWKRRYPDGRLSDERFWSVSSDDVAFASIPTLIVEYERIVDDRDQQGYELTGETLVAAAVSRLDRRRLDYNIHA